MTSSSRPSGSSTPHSVEVSPTTTRSLDSANWRWRSVHGHAPSRLQSELARAIEALANHPHLGVAVGRNRRIRLAVGYYVVYRVFPRKRG
ncbi:MAG: type II toxin-antitoxin system RelE/ParE family toxin [Deltaproteobacteria bacterium]|nr:type II toxin-antitoxin system RelE/ParE family toxin [Deltaproteobacteria bacterium]